MDQNGFLTHDELAAESEFTLTLANGRKIRCRRIGRAEYLAFLPAPPPESEDWPKIEGEGEALEQRQRARRKAELAWLRTLPDAEQIRERQRLNDVVLRTISLVALQPTLTLDQARRLGEEANALFEAILKRSNLLADETPTTGAAAEAAS